MPALVGPDSSPNMLSCRNQPVLSGPKILLRPWVDSDASSVVDAYSDPDIQRWNMRAMNDIDEARSWIRSWRTQWSADSDAGWAITTDRGDVAGSVSLRTVHSPSSSAVPQKQPWSQQFTADSETDSEIRDRSRRTKEGFPLWLEGPWLVCFVWPARCPARTRFPAD